MRTSQKETTGRKAFELIIDMMLNKLSGSENKREYYLTLADLVAKLPIKELNSDSIGRVKQAILDPENRWFKVIDEMVDNTDPNVLKQTVLNLGFEAFLNGTRTIRKNREIYKCNIPWLILFDPTQACNMHCAGCWSGTYGRKSSLSFDDMDKIVTEGKALGTHLYLMTGGEPLVRKDDILRLMEKHSDCQFAAFTNSTLVDQEFCDELKRLGNLILMVSIEGTPETNDARRGDGHYAAAMKAMDLLHENGIIFGTSICYTSENIDAVTDPAFLRMLAGKGAHFGFYFHYMPVGKNAVPELMPSPEQRLTIIQKLRWIRSKDCDIPFFPMDFQNDGEYVGGCIAGGRNYFHINADGDAEPCVFIHYSDSNIHDKSVLEILKSPLFMAYHHMQPFNQNHLRPCPMLENPELLRHLVKDTGAHQTNQEAPEEVDELCDKCKEYADSWEPAAEKEWRQETHKKPVYTNYAK